MDLIKSLNNNIGWKTSNKVIDSLENLQSFTEVVKAKHFAGMDAWKHFLFVQNIKDEKLKIEKNDKWEYRITRVNYDKLDLLNKDELKDDLLGSLEKSWIMKYNENDINTFIKKDIEVVKYYYNDKSLNNWFLPVTQNTIIDYDRNSIHFDDITWDIESICNPLKKEVYIEKWFIEKRGLVLPEKKQIETSVISMVNWDLKNFILENDITVVEYNLEEIKADILSNGSWFEWWLQRIENIINKDDLSDSEKVLEIKNEYGTGGGSLSIKKRLDWFQDHSPWLWIIYKMDNGQVFPFPWKKVFNIFNEYFQIDKRVNKEFIDNLNKDNIWEGVFYQSERERDNELKKIKDKVWVDKNGNTLNGQCPLNRHISEKWKKWYFIAWIKEPYKSINDYNEKEVTLLDINNKQLWIIDNGKIQPTIEEKINKIDLEKDFLYEEKIWNPLRLEIKKKALFGLIENNKMGKFILEKQPFHKKINAFSQEQLNDVRKLINNNEIYKAKMSQLRCLYENYNLEDLDWISWEFSKIFNTFSRQYLKSAFQIRIYKIAERINDYDNPVQSLEDYFHSIRSKDFNFTLMDIDKFKKVVSGMSVLYNHDLLNVSQKELKWVIKNINKFMKWVKTHIVDSNMSYKEIDDILVKGFVKNYKKVISL